MNSARFSRKYFFIRQFLKQYFSTSQNIATQPSYARVFIQKFLFPVIVFMIAFFSATLFSKVCSADMPAEDLFAQTFEKNVLKHHDNIMKTAQQNEVSSSIVSHPSSQISLSVKNASLQEIVAALSKMSGKNIIADTRNTDSITLHLEKVSLLSALDILTAAQGLAYTEKEGVIFIGKEDILKKQAAGFYTFPLNYTRAEDLQKALSAILDTGKIAADSGSNSLLFNGSPTEARKIQEALQTLDTATRQVTLEAKILSINQSDEKNLGLQWNWDTLPQYSSNKEKNTDTAANSKETDKGHLRLWPQTHAKFQFNVTLNALISSGKAKVLATPSLITIPGKEACIFIGSHIPVITEKHTNGESTYSTEYVDAGIKLTYTPIVSQDGYITSSVHTEVSTPSLISELKNYRINSRTADTNVRMRNGETLVIGGLISEEEQKQLQQIPFLSKIPLLGELFKNRYSSKNKTEVIMLLTPYLSEAGKSPSIYGEQ